MLIEFVHFGTLIVLNKFGISSAKKRGTACSAIMFNGVCAE
ncbi:MAG TPA: hypothetical protein VIL26_04715 [Clostridia bacterium]